MPESEMDVAVSKKFSEWGDATRRAMAKIRPYYEDKRGRIKDKDDLRRLQVAAQYDGFDEVVRPLLERIEELESPIKESRYLNKVLSWAEWEKGLDPIGASDMLGDLAKTASSRYREFGEEEPQVVFDAFWAQYGRTYYPDGTNPWEGNQGI